VSEVTAERWLTGREAPPPPAIELHAGLVEVLLVDGDLRYLRANGTEVVRRIYVAVRDLDWNTLPGELTNLQVHQASDSFEVTFSRRHRLGPVDFSWTAHIAGRADGQISYRMDGHAEQDFPYAKIGICIHHPIRGFAGQAFTGATPDGPVTGVLPDAIGPQIHLDDGTDLPLFDPVSELDVDHADGATVRFQFAGDLWEMEDQRNWTDASYKSASTPASLGYHHEAVTGQRFDQSVTITTSGFALKPVAPSGRIGLGGPSGITMPRVGLNCSRPDAALTARASNLFALIGASHLRVDLDLTVGDAGATSTLADASALSAQLATPLELAVTFPAVAEAGEAARLLAAQLGIHSPGVARILVFGHQAESTDPELTAEVARWLRPATAAPLVAGTNIYFNELNRHRRSPGSADGLVWSINPQIHAFDELSLVENLQAQPDTVATARGFAAGASLHVSPVSLRPRFNAVATTDDDFAVGGLPWNTDPRQPTLFTAVWTLGSAAALAAAGAASVTYYDTVGARGVIETERPQWAPAQFPSSADTAYPCAIVLADLCSLAGAELLSVDGIDDLELTVLATRHAGGATVLIGNLTREAVDLQLGVGDGAAGRLRIMDDASVARAASDPRAFVASGTDWSAIEGGLKLRIGGYGYARVDMM
jgi:D-apionolactonase